MDTRGPVGTGLDTSASRLYFVMGIPELDLFIALYGANYNDPIRKGFVPGPNLRLLRENLIELRPENSDKTRTMG